MARTRYGTDRGLSARMAGTMFGLGLLYVILAAVLISFGVNAWFVLIISGGMLFAQWWFSDSMAMAAMRATRPSTPMGEQSRSGRCRAHWASSRST